MTHYPSNIDNAAIYPVILPVPETARQLSGRKKVIYLSGFARRAVKLSAARGDIRLGDLVKDADGAPVPLNGVYWSITHKSAFVGGVAARYPIGLDIEKVKPCSQGLKNKVAGKSEWALSTERSDRLFFRFWTAKEAGLKAAGVGLKDLSRCKIAKLADETHLTVRYASRIWRIEQYDFQGHMAAIVLNDPSIHWSVEPLETAERLSANVTPY